MKAGVYKITHKESSRCYIGSALDVHHRLKTHKWLLRNKRHANVLLQNSYNKHGEDSFSFSILLFCSKNDRLFYEQKCLDGYQTYVKEFGYNIRRVAESNSGVPMHPNTKESIRKMWLDPDFRKRRNVPEAGERHGRLVLIELREKTAGSYTWLCKCDCGKEYLKKVACLRKGMTTSCGCYNSEMSSKRRKEKTGVITTFVELFGERIGIREAEKRLGIGKNVIARKARVKKITLQEATEYFINFKRKKSL